MKKFSINDTWDDKNENAERKKYLLKSLNQIYIFVNGKCVCIYEYVCMRMYMYVHG